jgi:hypothetical protein
VSLERAELDVRVIDVRWSPVCEDVSLGAEEIVDCWKALPSRALKTETGIINLCVIVICEM